MHIDHLHGGELLQHGSRCKPRRQRAQALLQGHLQAVGEEGDKDVGVDTFIELVVDRTDGQVAFELFERLLDFSELDVVLP